jgi:hypothetical protein
MFTLDVDVVFGAEPIGMKPTHSIGYDQRNYAHLVTGQSYFTTRETTLSSPASTQFHSLHDLPWSIPLKRRSTYFSSLSSWTLETTFTVDCPDLHP